MRRIWNVIAISLFLAAGCSSAGPASSGGDVPLVSGSTAATGTDALTKRALTQLGTFTGWLEEHDVRGYIGEVGWPDDSDGEANRWNALADLWFRAADAEHLWVTVWAVGEWWGNDYRLAPYEATPPDRPVDAVNSQAAVLEAPLGTGSVLRGVNDAGGEFGGPVTGATSSFSNANPGAYDVAYHYDSSATFQFLAAHGVKLVRIPFRWERLQPSLGEALDGDEVGRLEAVVTRAHDAGLQVILDMHNFGAYYLSDGSQGVRRPIGSSECSIDDFVDVWLRMSSRFQDVPGVIGYDLMNEPVGLQPVELGSLRTLSPARVWHEASQAALSAIRARGDRTLILVSGYGFAGVQTWGEVNGDPWIEDSAGNFRYEAHQYFDGDNSGSYGNSYETEVANAEAAGF